MESYRCRSAGVCIVISVVILFQVAIGVPTTSCDGLQYQGWCIQIKITDIKSYTEYASWNEAAKDCTTNGHRLVSIESEDKLSEILKHFSKETNTNNRLYIGLSRQAGLSRNTLKDWKWTSNFSLNYKNWGTGDPNFDNSQCAGALLSNGKFLDLSCDEKTAQIGLTYIYEFPIVSTTMLGSTTSTPQFTTSQQSSITTPSLETTEPAAVTKLSLTLPLTNKYSRPTYCDACDNTEETWWKVLLIVAFVFVLVLIIVICFLWRIIIIRNQRNWPHSIPMVSVQTTACVNETCVKTTQTEERPAQSDEHHSDCFIGNLVQRVSPNDIMGIGVNSGLLNTEMHTMIQDNIGQSQRTSWLMFAKIRQNNPDNFYQIIIKAFRKCGREDLARMVETEEQVIRNNLLDGECRNGTMDN